MSKVFDARLCELGEGALWHPLRKGLFWFDILGQKLFSRDPAGNNQSYDLPRICSAAAWVDHDRLLIASETGLDIFDLSRGEFTAHLTDLEADNPLTRSNDGRADPLGGFWIGTMGKSAQQNVGGIYRFYKGELRKLFSDITIPNAICFAPSGKLAYFADTAKAQIFRCELDDHGWPKAPAEVFVDLKALGYHPDGAICLSDGSLRVALWGAGAVLEISASGGIGALHRFAAPHLTCPAAGGENFRTLYVTSARQDLSQDDLAKAPLSGAVFSMQSAIAGRAEPAFVLDF